MSKIKEASINEILEYNVSSTLKLDIVLDTIKILKKNKAIKLHKDAFIHSDQCVQYTNPKYQKIVKKAKLGQSMSRLGNCWDNAPQESFFGHTKDEINYKAGRTFQELEIVIDEYMDYYNNYRYQWGLKKLAPV